eukprot:1168572-Pleurochrysis_carterae.AAC.2
MRRLRTVVLALHNDEVATTQRLRARRRGVTHLRRHARIHAVSGRSECEGESASVRVCGKWILRRIECRRANAKAQLYPCRLYPYARAAAAVRALRLF